MDLPGWDTRGDGGDRKGGDSVVVDRQRRGSMKRWGWWLGLLVFGCLVGMIGAGEARAGYVDHHNGTVSDTRTGLMWQQG